MRTKFTVLLALAVPLLGSQAFGRDEQRCDEPLIAQALRPQLPRQFPEGDGTGGVIALACKTHPQQSHLTIVAMFHFIEGEKGGWREGEKGFVVAVVDTRRSAVQSLYRATLEEDAGLRVNETSLWIDTARYDLAPSVRAFGVRMDIGYSPRCADGGTSHYLTLFVPDKNRLRPVLLTKPMRQWEVLGWNPDEGACMQAGVATTTLALTLGNAAKNGWRDLHVSARTESEAFDYSGVGGTNPSPLTRWVATLRYDGSRYVDDVQGYDDMLKRPTLP